MQHSDRRALLRVILKLAGFGTLAIGQFVLIYFLVLNAPEGAYRKLSKSMGITRPVASAEVVEKRKDLLRIGGKELDVLFVGSSHCYRTFDTRYFDAAGIRSFNLGTSSQTPMNTYRLLRSLGDRIRYRTVVIEAMPELFHNSGAESSIDLISGLWESLPSRMRSFELANDRRVEYAWLSRQLWLEEPTIKGSPDDEYIPGGFVERKVTGFKGDSLFHCEWEETPFQYNYYRCLLRSMSRKGIETVVVMTPYRRDPSLARMYAETTAKIKSLCSAYQTRFIDFNDELNYSIDYYYDASHLNREGLAEFLPFFTRRMRELGVKGFN